MRPAPARASPAPNNEPELKKKVCWLLLFIERNPRNFCARPESVDGASKKLCFCFLAVFVCGGYVQTVGQPLRLLAVFSCRAEQSAQFERTNQTC